MNNMTEITDCQWERFSKKERLVWMKLRRSDQPATARVMLESHWEQESPRDRAELLATFDIGISSEDEAFLEKCLKDPDRTIRRIAANHLSRIPDSDYAHDLLELANHCLAIKKTGSTSSIHVSLPETYDSKIQHLAIEETHPRYEELFDRPTSWLHQILFRTPPALWKETLEASPLELLEIAKASDYEILLGWAWSTATLLHRDIDWAQAFIKIPQTKGLRFTTQSPHAFLDILPSQQHEAFILNKISAANRNPTRLADVFQQLPQDPALTWSPAISQAILSTLDSLLPTLERTKFRNYNLLSLFSQAALHMDTQTLPPLREILTRILEKRLHISHYIEPIVETLHNRLD